MGGKTENKTQVDPKVQGLQLDNYARSEAIADTPVTPYSGALDLGASRQAVQGLMGYSPTTVTADSVTASQIDRSKIADVSTQKLSDIDLTGYLNPYIDNVVATTNADIERARQVQRSADSAGASIANAWGGSRHGVADAATNEAALRTTASTDAQLRSAGFTAAQTAAQTDMARKLQADLANQGVSVTVEQANAMLTQQASLANQDAKLRAAMSNQQAEGQAAAVRLQSAGLMGDMSKAEYEAAYNEWLRQQNDPLLKQQMLNQSLSAISVPQTTTQTYKPGLFDYMKVGAQTAAAVAMAGAGSDRRIKTDIEFLRTDDKGRRWYSYRYVWDEPGTRREGVMAQEVMETDPHAVSTHPMGFLMVDYGALK